MKNHSTLTKLVVLFLCLIAFASDTFGQGARPILGKLTVQIPRAFLPSDDYWIYVNSQIVSSPGRKSTIASDGTLHVSTGEGNDRREEFFDREGLAARSAQGKMTFIRSDWKGKVFENKTLQLSPASYKVELLTRNVDSEGIPFSIAQIKVDVKAGQTTTIEFGVPTGTRETTRLAIRANYASNGLDLKAVIADFDGTTKALEADPIMPPLMKTLTSMSTSPPSQPGVYVGFPDSLGGGREFELKQLNLIIDQLAGRYSFDDRGALNKGTSAEASIISLLRTQIDQHNKRFQTFRDVVKVLEKFKRPVG